MAHPGSTLVTISDDPAGAHPLPAVVGNDLLRPPGRLERAWAWLEWRLSTLTGHDLNPLAHAGTLAALSFLLVLISGIYLFLVYDVAAPYASVQALDASILGATMRSIHRYASRTLILFVLVHALRLGLAGRFRGPRLLSWQTGLVEVAIIWFLGVSGYLLVWDDQAQVVATAVADLLDSVVLFVQPFRLTLLANERVLDNLFFVLLFLHLSVPLLGALIYLLHVSRVSRPQWLPPRRFLVLFSGVVVLASIVFPARSGSVADLGWLPVEVALDPWYSSFVLPLTWWSLGVGFLVLVVPLLVTALLPLIPKKPPAPAKVLNEACRGCRLCANDCPYGAITMVPAPEPRVFERVSEVALVAPERCVSCGVCLGSCNFDGIVLGRLDGPTLRETAGEWTRSSSPADDRPAWGRGLQRDPLSDGRESDGRQRILVMACRWPGVPELPIGCEFLAVPCAGVVNRTLVARVLTEGDGGLLIAVCGDALCAYREGGQWTRLRAERQRHPGWPPRAARRIRLVEVQPGDTAALAAAARSFRDELAADTASSAPRSRAIPLPLRRSLQVGVGTLVAMTLVFAMPFDLSYTPGPSDGGLLKVGLRAEAPLAEERLVSPEEMSERLEHMRGQEFANRERLPLTVEVQVDGGIVLDTVFYPRGFRRDGPTYGYVDVPLPVGRHRIEARIEAEGGDEPLQAELHEEIDVAPRQVRVLSYGALEEGLVLR